MSVSLEDVLNELNSLSSNEKVAASADTLTEKVAEAETALDSALNTLNNLSTDDNQTTNDLHKMAENLATAEEEALAKEAALYGAAMAEGFLLKIAEFEQAFGDENDVDNPPVDKIAEAAIQGYNDALQSIQAQDLMKTAAIQQQLAERAAMEEELMKQAALEEELIKQAALEEQLAQEAYAHGVDPETYVAMLKEAALQEQASAEEQAMIEAIASGYNDINSILQ